jgi:O-glycosyl hydrolase
MSLKHSQFKNYLKQKIVCRINTTSHRIKATNSYLALVYVCKNVYEFLLRIFKVVRDSVDVILNVSLKNRLNFRKQNLKIL